MRKGKLIITAEFEFTGLPDYYPGHGHAFEEGLIACLGWSVYISGREMVKEIIEAIIEDVRAYPWDIVDPQFYEKYAEEVDSITEEDLEFALRENLLPETKDSDPFYDTSLFEDESEDEEDSYLEGPVEIGYFHIYKAE